MAESQVSHLLTTFVGSQYWLAGMKVFSSYLVSPDTSLVVVGHHITASWGERIDFLRDFCWWWDTVIVFFFFFWLDWISYLKVFLLIGCPLLCTWIREKRFLLGLSWSAPICVSELSASSVSSLGHIRQKENLENLPSWSIFFSPLSEFLRLVLCLMSRGF